MLETIALFVGFAGGVFFTATLYHEQLTQGRAAIEELRQIKAARSDTSRRAAETRRQKLFAAHMEKIRGEA